MRAPQPPDMISEIPAGPIDVSPMDAYSRVVCALGRSLPTRSEGHVRVVENVIQTDAGARR